MSLIDQYQDIAKKHGLTEWMRTPLTSTPIETIRAFTSAEAVSFCKAHGVETAGSKKPADLVAFIQRARVTESKRLSAVSKRLKTQGVVAAAKATMSARGKGSAVPATLDAADAADLAEVTGAAKS